MVKLVVLLSHNAQMARLGPINRVLIVKEEAFSWHFVGHCRESVMIDRECKLQIGHVFLNL